MTNDHNDRVLMGFNVEELRRVADCLRVLNPARAPNVDGTMRYIAAHAKAQLPDKPGYVETMGFCTTAYHDHTGRLLYKVTLSSYGVAEFIAKVQERIGTEMFASFWRPHGHRNPQADVIHV